MTKPASMRWTIFWLVITGLLLLSLLVANYLRQSSQNTQEFMELGFVSVSEPAAIEPFNLVDHLGEPAGRKLLLDHWSLLFFGFTHCPDVCPTTLGVLNKVVTELGPEAPKVILITADPARDTPEQLRGYVTAFNPDFIALTGEPEALKALGYQVRVAFMRTDESENYMVEHTANIALINPAGEFVGYFTIPHREENIAHVLKRVM